MPRPSNATTKPSTPLTESRCCLRSNSAGHLSHSIIFVISSARRRSHHQQRLVSARNSLGQFRIHPGKGQILLARKESQKRPSLPRPMIPNRPLQHRIGRLQRIQNRAQRRRSAHHQPKLAPHLRKRPQMGGQLHPNHSPVHASVCTSTDNTAGRSRTIAVQFSPPSADPYTCPPVVPK